MKKIIFIFEKLKNTESAQLCFRQCPWRKTQSGGRGGVKPGLGICGHWKFLVFNPFVPRVQKIKIRQLALADLLA